MIRKVKTKADSYLRQRCERLSMRSRKWIILSMFGAFTAAFIYNLIIEFL
ncbi:MAG: TraL conjugative transposon family protein [Rikenellaceae bacterium]